MGMYSSRDWPGTVLSIRLSEGVWEGKQIVSAEWVREATAKHVATDEGFGHGYQWWVDEKSAHASPGAEPVS